MSFADDYFNELNKKKKKKESPNSDKVVTSGNDYATEYFKALNEDTERRTPTTFMKADDDDIAPVFEETKKPSQTIETTQAIFDKYGKYYNLPDYEEYSKKGASIVNPTFDEAEGLNLFGWRPFSKEVGNVVTYSRDNVESILMGELNSSQMVGSSKYRNMTDFEVGIYNYLLAKEGKDVAQEFLDDIEETLNAREGKAVANNIKSVDNDALKTILYGGVSVGSGTESAITGIKQLFSEEALPTTANEFLNQELVSDLDGFAKTAYQAGNTVGNMLPSVAVSFVNPAAGRIIQGSSAAGNAYRQSLKEGKTKEEAAAYGVMMGGLEFVTSKLLGGVAKTTGDIPKKALSKIASFENALLRVGAKYAITTGSEITEEELQLWLEPFVRTIAFGEDYDAPTLEEMAETAIVTALSTNILNAGTDIATGNVTKVNGLTQHEAKVINAEVENRIAEQEKDGKKLSSKAKEKIYNDVVEQMDKGQLDIDTIESVLGGETYETYKNLTEQENALQSQKKAIESEISDLVKTPESQFTIEQRERLTSLREEAKGIKDNIKALDTKTAKSNLFNEVNKLTENDTRLRESYNEKERRGQAFTADLTKYKGRQREAVERAIKSGVLNNTYRSHELVDTLSKIEADKGIVFDYTNNKRLKESGFAVKGKTVNGFVKDGGITLNVQSPKAWQSTVGHEISHILEGTEAYGALRETLYAYAESKGELANRRTALTELYNGMNADIDAELTADLVGEYLFSDKDFINKLTGNRPLFKKVWDEVKYLCKVATGKELTEIEKVEREFARAWKEQGQIAQSEESGKQFDNGETEKVQYSIRKEAPPKETGVAYKVFYVKDGKLYPPMVANPDGADTPMGVWLNADVGTAAPPSKTGRAQVKAGGKGTQGGSGSLAFRPGWHLGDLPRASQFDRVNPETGKKELFPENFVWAEVEYAKDVDYQEEAMSYGYTENGKFRHAYAGLPKLPENGYYRYRTNPKPDTVPWVITGAMKVNRLLSDAEVNEILEKNGVPAVHRQGGDVGLDKFGFDEGGKAKYSLSEDISKKDSNGNELSLAVQKRFANSKAVDENGNLKVLYHGTASGEFFTFDKSKGNVEGDFGSGFYFTDNEGDVEANYEGGGADFENKVARRAEQIEAEEDIEYSEAEARAREELYVGSNKFEVYLNIENPAIVGETTLFDYESYAEEYDRNDYDSDEDYEGDVEQLIANDIDQIIWDIDRNIDIYSTDGIAEVLWNAVNEGGIGIEQLKAQINELYLEDNNGNLVGNEVTRQIIESLGYDGIIDNTVSSKFNMGLSEDTTHYIVFKPNQIKDISNQTPTDNPDIRYSVSKSSLDNGMDLVYNVNDLYTESDSFVLEVDKNDRHIFPRSLANKTADLGKDEVRIVEIYGANKVYFFEATGYMQGQVLKSVSADDYDGYIKSRKDYENGINRSSETPNTWVNTLSAYRKGARSDISDIGIRRGKNDVDGIYGRASERNGTGTQERGRQNFEDDPQKVESVIAELRKQYGLTENHPTNEIAPIKEVSSTDDAFFDGENTDVRYSISPETDAEYMLAVENGDMETAQRLVNEAAEKSGYADDSSWKMQHKAPNAKDDISLVTLKESGLVPDDYWQHPEWYTYTAEERESFYKVKDAIERQERYTAEGKPREARIWVYRAVDKTKNSKEDYFRNGDWVTPSYNYAVNEGRMNNNGYRIIKHSVPIKNLYWDGNSIAELGYDDGNTYAYADTLNNRKLLDPVTYDEFGLVIPLSKRFNRRKSETNYSLSYEGERFAPIGNYSTPLNETALEQDIAPMATVEKTVPDVAEEDMFPSEISPVDELAQLESRIEVVSAEKEALKNEVEQLYRQNAQQIITSEELQARVEEIRPKFKKVSQEFDSLIERISSIENAEKSQRREFFDGIRDEDIPPEAEAPYYGEEFDAEDPFKNRDIKTVGSQKVKAYMYENPEVKPFFQEEANIMLGELNSTTKGERWYNKAAYYASYDAAMPKVFGVPRHTTDDIATLLDVHHYSYDQIRNGLKAIIEDNGKENNAISKRIEFLLNDRLLYGYQDISGFDVPPNTDYENLLKEKQITEYNEESFKRFMETPSYFDDIAPVLENIPVLPDEELEQGTHTAIRPKPTKQPSLKKVNNAESQEHIAKVLTEEPKVEKKKKGIISTAIANFIDKGAVFENLSLKTKNRALQDTYKAIGRSETKAQYFMENGTENVKSLDAIRAEVEKTGKVQDFYNYIYHKHNIDRMNLESKERPNLERLVGEMNKFKLLHLQENQLRAIASEKITKETAPKRAKLIKTVQEYLASNDVKNKPVFDYSVTSKMSQDIVNEYEAKNPDFKEYAQDVYDYMNHLRKMMVYNGIISPETAELWAKMYPHYVPIRRVGNEGLAVNVPLDTNKTGINAPIKRATGGNSDILPLFETMAQRTTQTFKAIDKNRFGIELKDTLGGVTENTKTNLDEVIDSIDAQDSLLQEGKNGKNPTFTVFEGGDRVTFDITEEMYDALKPTSEGLSYTNKVLNTASNLHRGVLTEYSVPFMVTNAIKDAQDVLINSQHPAKTYAKFPTAIKELATKGKWYTEYMENGGGDNTYFDKQTNTFNKEKSQLRKIIGFPLDKISDANNFIEKVPRLAEYIASRENGTSVDAAMLDAARVTTDFSAGGDVTKFLNRNGATFLNASVQGFAQQVRNVREAKMNGLKGWLGLATKYAIAGLPALLLNGALWDDDEEYEELSDYVKENYYIVGKYGDGKFVRIPKGRALAVIQNGFEQVSNALTGNDEVDFGRFFELFLSNLAPNNPLDNNIIAPIKQVMENKTWYGEDLVPSRLQDLPAAEQYDESTDAISKWLGENLNVSPYKINYLLNQYSGGVGDIFLPMLTPEAESGDNSFGGNIIAPLKDKFTTDSVMNNQNVSDFYDTVDVLTKNAKSSYATDEDILKSKYINSVNTELGDLYKSKREIQNSNLSDSVKYEQVRNIQEQINNLAKNALNSYENVNVQDGYATVGDKHYRLDDGVWTKISAKQLERQKQVTSELGISPAEYWSKTNISYFPNSDGEYEYAYDNPEKYAVSKVVGGYDTYKTYSKELYNIKADKDKNGKSINGSRKEKVLDYINNLDADYETKIILFKTEYPADDTYNVDIINYINERGDLTYEERIAIFTELGFTVSDGSVYW